MVVSELDCSIIRSLDRAHFGLLVRCDIYGKDLERDYRGKDDGPSLGRGNGKGSALNRLLVYVPGAAVCSHEFCLGVSPCSPCHLLLALLVKVVLSIYFAEERGLPSSDEEFVVVRIVAIPFDVTARRPHSFLWFLYIQSPKLAESSLDLIEKMWLQWRDLVLDWEYILMRWDTVLLLSSYIWSGVHYCSSISLRDAAVVKKSLSFVDCKQFRVNSATHPFIEL